MDPTILINPLMQLGVPGILIALVLFVYRELRTSWDDRLKDLDKLNETIRAQTVAQLAATHAQEERNRAIEGLAQAQQQMARTIEQAHNQNIQRLEANAQKLDSLLRDVMALSARESYRRDS